MPNLGIRGWNCSFHTLTSGKPGMTWEPVFKHLQPMEPRRFCLTGTWKQANLLLVRTLCTTARTFQRVPCTTRLYRLGGQMKRFFIVRSHLFLVFDLCLASFDGSWSWDFQVKRKRTSDGGLGKMFHYHLATEAGDGPTLFKGWLILQGSPLQVPCSLAGGPSHGPHSETCEFLLQLHACGGMEVWIFYLFFYNFPFSTEDVSTPNPRHGKLTIHGQRGVRDSALTKS